MPQNADRRRRTAPAASSPKSPAQSRTSGSSAGGTPNSSQQLLVPVAAVDVEQQGARGVGRVGGVHLAAGQPPEQEAVDRAEGELAGLGRRARAVDVVEQPGDLGGGEIGIEQQAGLRRDRRLVAVARAALRRASAVRRSCQTMALWIGLPVARSQTIAVSRWLVMPMRGDVLGRDAGLRHAPRARSRPSRARSPRDRARPSPAPDRSARTPAARSRPARASASNTIARVEVVPWSMARRWQVIGAFTRRLPAVARLRHEAASASRSRRQAQAELGAPPQHVLGGPRPFVPHQIAHLGRREVGAEARRRESSQRLGVAQDALDPRAVGAHQPPRMRPRSRNGQARERPRHERVDAVAGKVAARQRRLRSRPAASRRNARACRAPPRPAGDRS